VEAGMTGKYCKLFLEKGYKEPSCICSE